MSLCLLTSLARCSCRRVVLPFVGLDLLYWLLAIIINATHTAVPRVPQTTVGQINAMVWIDIRGERQKS